MNINARTALLQQCEAFLLHPKVRMLSLAQRVGFLEKKGLSANEISDCLHRIQTKQHSLNPLPISHANAPIAAVQSLEINVSKNIRLYTGILTIIGLCMGYGYSWLRYRALYQAQQLFHTKKQKERIKRLKYKTFDTLQQILKERMETNNELFKSMQMYLEMNEKNVVTKHSNMNVDLLDVKKQIQDIKSCIQ